MTQAIFLSYASQDADAARCICEALRAAGLEVWFDQSELRGGDAWDASIRKQIKECALFIPIISAATNARSEGYFRLEWKLAVDRSHLMAAERAFLLPIVIDDTTDAAALVPDKFREVQWTRLMDGHDTDAFAQHVKALLATTSLQPNRGADNGAIAKPHKPHTSPTPLTARPNASRMKWLAAAGTLIALLALATAVMFLRKGADKAIGSIAVLPFENSTGDASIDYLSDGISESLINKLSSLNGLRVISRTSAFAFKGEKITPIEIGKKLGVDALIIGTLAQRGANLSISSELVRVSNATQLWGEKYNRQRDDVLKVEGEIATTIAQTLRRQLSSDEKAKLTRTATSDPEAYRLYLKGRGFLVGTNEEMDKSVDYLQQAVAKAPEFALAHAGLAEAFTRQAFLRASDRTTTLAKARAEAQRALELDPQLAEAHTALAMVRFYFEWDWAGADSAFRRGLELNPGSVTVHEEYGIFLSAMGRTDEALTHSNEAVRLDPLSVSPLHDTAIIAMGRKEYDKAIDSFRRTLEIDPGWTWGNIKLARAYAMAGKCQESAAQAEIAEKRIAGAPAPLGNSWLASGFAVCGDRDRAKRKLDGLLALQKKQYVDPTVIAFVHVALGELDAAMPYFEKAYADHSPNMAFARVMPRLNPGLENEPRFAAIVARMNYPKP